ncbi:MAG: hypothetical protein EBS48_05135, partial [Actinobacteria bacterium]|nr:hypothetical protein [Actinomycetota bacterium]
MSDTEPLRSTTNTAATDAAAAAGSAVWREHATHIDALQAAVTKHARAMHENGLRVSKQPKIIKILDDKDRVLDVEGCFAVLEHLKKLETAADWITFFYRSVR